VLPTVSIVTLVHGRPEFIPLMIHNFFNIIYDRTRLIEWVIVDDSKISFKDKFPDDGRLKYIKLSSRKGYTVGFKRNIGVAKSCGEIIVFMDDDDIIIPISVSAKVRTLLNYPSKRCVGSLRIGVYDIVNKLSLDAIEPPDPIDGVRKFFPEAGMAFWRDFWKERPFDDDCNQGEGQSFLRGRETKLIDIPYGFNMIAITHKRNLTGNLRSGKGLKQQDEQDKKYWDTVFTDEQKQILIRIINYQNELY